MAFMVFSTVGIKNNVLATSIIFDSELKHKPWSIPRHRDVRCLSVFPHGRLMVGVHLGPLRREWNHFQIKSTPSAGLYV